MRIAEEKLLFQQMPSQKMGCVTKKYLQNQKHKDSFPFKLKARKRFLQK